MIATALGILTASVLGSVHCAAMCGGFVCMYAGTAETRTDQQSPPLKAHALYNVGRLISYLFLGAMAGAVGARVTHLGAFVGVARAATLMAGVLMIGWGASVLLAQFGVRRSHSTVPQWWQRSLGRALYALRNQPTSLRAGMLGLLTTLVPCGWLYVFVAAAAGTGSVLDGVMVMAVFWLGTVPALLAVGVGAQRLFGPFRTRLPALSAITVVLMGVLALSGRLVMSAAPHVH